MLSTNIYYPESLPGPLRENHNLQPAATFERTTMASGRSRVRKTFSKVPTLGSWEFLFTSLEATIFEAWFRDQLKDGVEWFNAKRLTPMGRQSLICRFTSMYAGPNLVGISRWRFSCPIEIIERPLLPEGWGEFPTFIAQSNVLDVALNREWPEA